MSHGGRVSVTENLESALRHLRLEDKPRVMWIDAICINQSDHRERSKQVARMGQIYALADRVVVWLGPASKDSDAALGFIERMARMLASPDKSETSIKAASEASHWADASDAHVLEYTEWEWRSVLSLLRRSWFERLWVRQEIQQSRHAILLCGKTSLPWMYFREVANYLYRKPFRIQGSCISSPEYTGATKLAYYLCRAAKRGVTYRYLRFETYSIKHSDPRDSIYGVLSLMRREDRSLNITPDYSLSTVDVFRGVVLRVVEKHHSLRTLACADSATSSVPGLPSWVPDWSSPTKTTPLKPLYSASAFISAQATYCGNNMLRVAGIPVATVDSSQHFDLSGDGLDDQFRAIRQLRPDKSLESPYPGGISLLDAYCEALNCTFHFDEDMVERGNWTRFRVAAEALRHIWSADGSQCHIPSNSVHSFLNQACSSLAGRCVVTTSEGYIGAAAAGAQAGDVVCVLLGFENPVLLRKVLDAPPRWRVVGSCYVPGFMHGEAIHGPLPKHYRPVFSLNAAPETLIDGAFCGLWDERSGSIERNPARVLDEVGVSYEIYQRWPHILSVSTETLRNAKVNVHDFHVI
ncbi:heterokaryon incompatibility protein-domain-containing protein [Stachybotrys elegans]|uniref:Heterokaryon incompatibility protein-domain-containing protein n=1 Tax=Stachybotrys elegans TaxID=80388 RepID=A0A8K0SJ28_9HYPO|nr:heterokaryon incompatibility protein-domain-containing protein [Stachybotrys elegans]